MTGIPPTLEGLSVPVASLKAYPSNPRRGSVSAIVESLRRHGQYRPIVVNRRTTEVLAGNHTLRAALELGWEEIAATFVDVDEDTAARIVLVDNRSNDVAGYDDEQLAELLSTLPDLDGTGFTEDDYQALVAGLTRPSDGDWGAAFDGVPEGERDTPHTMTLTLDDDQFAVINRLIDAYQEQHDVGPRDAKAQAIAEAATAYMR